MAAAVALRRIWETMMNKLRSCKTKKGSETQRRHYKRIAKWKAELVDTFFAGNDI